MERRPAVRRFPDARVSEAETSRILRRDMLLLAVVAACTVGLFLITKAVAARQDAIDSHVAAYWYADGERKLSAGQADGAIDSLRKATGIDRENPLYMLALADALAQGNHTIEAQQALQRLREMQPTNADVNLRLARLAAKRGDIAEAVRFYHESLDGMWGGPGVARRRQDVRTELIHFLIERHDETRALSELLVLDSELPNNADARVQAAKLFLEEGDARHALDDFDEALRLDPSNGEARAGKDQAEQVIARQDGDAQ